MTDSNHNSNTDQKDQQAVILEKGIVYHPEKRTFFITKFMDECITFTCDETEHFIEKIMNVNISFRKFGESIYSQSEQAHNKTGD